MMQLSTERLLLRPFKKSDWHALHQILSDVDVMQYSLNGPYSAQKSKAFLEQCILRSNNNEPTLLAAIDKQTQQLIGSCGFFPQTIQRVAELELGYRFAKDYWGKGLATEATIALKRYAFNEMKLTRLISLINSHHIASIRVAEKNKFRLEKKMLYAGKIPISMYAVMR